MFKRRKKQTMLLDKMRVLYENSRCVYFFIIYRKFSQHTHAASMDKIKNLTPYGPYLLFSKIIIYSGSRSFS